MNTTAGRSPGLPLATLLTVVLGLGLMACDTNGQACESSVDCYVGESCVLGTCVLDEDPDLDAGPDTPDEDADAADTPDDDTRDTPGEDTGDTDADIIEGPLRPIAISAAMNFSCALLSDKTVWCWGDNSAGFITGADDEALTPRKIDGFDGAVEIATANARICVRTEEGAVLCRGDGTLGSGATLETKIISGAAMLASGGYHMCAAVGEDATLHCWGDNGFGQTGAPIETSDPTIDPTPVDGAINVTRIAGGDFHTCVATLTDQVRCFGDNYAGQLGFEGDPSLEPVPHPYFSTSRPPFELVAGSDHNCVLSEGARVWCWGQNTFGELAIDPDLLDSSAQPEEIAVGDALSDLAAGYHRTCGIGTAGKVYCWGFDHDQQVKDVHEIPDLEGVTQLAIGQRHTCALTRDHSITCWGTNHLGQLGNGSLNDADAPSAPVVASWLE